MSGQRQTPNPNPCRMNLTAGNFCITILPFGVFPEDMPFCLNFKKYPVQRFSILLFFRQVILSHFISFFLSFYFSLFLSPFLSLSNFFFFFPNSPSLSSCFFFVSFFHLFCNSLFHSLFPLTLLLSSSYRLSLFSYFPKRLLVSTNLWHVQSISTLQLFNHIRSNFRRRKAVDPELRWAVIDVQWSE